MSRRVECVRFNHKSPIRRETSLTREVARTREVTRTVRFGEVVSMMVEADLQAADQEAYLREGGFEVRNHSE